MDNKESWEQKKQYALSNSHISKGQILTDNKGSILVDFIDIGQTYGGVPTCIYWGVCLDDDGTHAASSPHRSINQTSKFKTTDL